MLQAPTFDRMGFIAEVACFALIVLAYKCISDALHNIDVLSERCGGCNEVMLLPVRPSRLQTESGTLSAVLIVRSKY
jgi:hypothetical protein